MTIVDRYLLFLFLRTFLVCFASFAGLFVVVHLFSNLDELVAISKSIGWGNLLIEFYLPRIADLFDKMAGIITLVAAIFAVSLLQRRREMTAIEASGITKARILRPIFLVAVGVIALTVINREWLIPQVKDRLVRTPQTWGDQGQIDLAMQEDARTGVVLRGDQLFLEERRISEADVQLPASVARQLPRVRASWAILEPATEYHPAGLRLHQVSQPEDIGAVPTLRDEAGEPVLFSPSDQKWLGPRQCFVPCDFELEQVAYGDQLINYQNTAQMIAAAKKPQKWFGGKSRQVEIHSRFTRPLLDITLILLGLPMVLGGIERNVFVSAGVCFWIIAAVHLTVMACSALGAASIIRPTALAAWLPLAIYFPLAVVAMRRLKS